MPAAHPSSPAEDAAGHAPRTPAGAMATIAVLLVAAFVVILNETVLNVALPHLMRGFTWMPPRCSG